MRTSLLTTLQILALCLAAHAASDVDWRSRNRGTLEQGDAVVHRDGVRATYPVYVDSSTSHNLNPSVTYVLLVRSADFRPLLHVQEQFADGPDSRQSFGSTTNGQYWYDNELRCWVSRLTFSPTTPHNTVTISVTSVDTHDRQGNIPHGTYFFFWGVEIQKASGPSWGDQNPADLGIKPRVGVVFPPYGGELLLYPDGDRLWNAAGTQYYIATANGFQQYDRDGNLRGTLVKTSEKTTPEGVTYWYGHVEDASGNRGGNWYCRWL
jgi:hypothetical protein